MFINFTRQTKLPPDTFSQERERDREERERSRYRCQDMLCFLDDGRKTHSEANNRSGSLLLNLHPNIICENASAGDP
jgi:hypothetical protein